MENKKHFGDPIHRRPLPFGKHYSKPKTNNDVVEEDDEVMPSYQNLEEKAIRSYTVIKVTGRLCWLIFGLALLYFSYFMSEHGENLLAVIVPLGGFLMICVVALVQKGYFKTRDNQSSDQEQKSDPAQERQPDSKNNFRRRKHFYRKR